jgi:hypothetical protein
MRFPALVIDCAQRLRGDSRGSVMAEYLVVVGVCAIVISAALASLGPTLVADYTTNRHTLIAPVP